MMPIIIPYRMCPNNGLELKYALRSIDKYLKMDYGDIYLIGDKFPSWLQNVKFIECHEESVKSSRNILNKVWKGLQVAGISIQWQDDIYLTRETKEIPYYYEGTLEEAINRHFGRYKAIIQNTAYKVTDAFDFFDVHTPIIYNPVHFSKVLRYEWDRKTFLVKTLYCESACEYGESYTDCKINGPHPKEIIKEKIGNSLYFSTSPQSITPEMIEVLEEMYPEKSKYEKNNC